MGKIILTIAYVGCGVIFLGLSIFHFNASNENVNHFEMIERKHANEGIKLSMVGSGVDEPLSNFIKDYNNYIDNELNPSISKQNKAAFWGYIIGFGLSIISILLIWCKRQN
ncbi:MAG: hypothetical protein K8S87_07365 [Planctomycetes bacterium]|nr:hypothetical protein [Planctomycetota bacterium]